MGIGIFGSFWGKFGSFGVSLGPLEIRSHSTANPMSFWAKFHHFCVNPKADTRDSLYRVRLGLGIGILGPFLGQIWVVWVLRRSAAIPLRTQCHFGPKSAIFATIQSDSEGIHFMGLDGDWELGFLGPFWNFLGSQDVQLPGPCPTAAPHRPRRRALQAAARLRQHLAARQERLQQQEWPARFLLQVWKV